MDGQASGVDRQPLRVGGAAVAAGLGLAGPLTATPTVVLIPTALVAGFLKKQPVSGLTMGALQG